MITAGQKVEIKKEFQDAGDENYTHVAIDNEEKGRVTIMTIIPGFSIYPTQVVRVEWLVNN